MQPSSITTYQCAVVVKPTSDPAGSLVLFFLEGTMADRILVASVVADTIVEKLDLDIFHQSAPARLQIPEPSVSRTNLQVLRTSSGRSQTSLEKARGLQSLTELSLHPILGKAVKVPSHHLSRPPSTTYPSSKSKLKTKKKTVERHGLIRVPRTWSAWRSC